MWLGILPRRSSQRITRAIVFRLYDCQQFVFIYIERDIMKYTTGVEINMLFSFEVRIRK